MSTTSSALRAVDLAEFAGLARKAIESGEQLRLLVGGTETIVERRLAEMIMAAIDLADGVEPRAGSELSALPTEITTGQAADLLGVSRPTVVALVDAGKIPARRIGTHRRVDTAGVLAFRDRQRNERSQALQDLVDVSDELGLYGDV